MDTAWLKFFTVRNPKRLTPKETWNMGSTLAEKVWADHLVRKGDDGAPDLLYIDLMLMH